MISTDTDSAATSSGDTMAERRPLRVRLHLIPRPPCPPRRRPRRRPGQRHDLSRCGRGGKGPQRSAGRRRRPASSAVRGRIASVRIACPCDSDGERGLRQRQAMFRQSMFLLASQHLDSVGKWAALRMSQCSTTIGMSIERGWGKLEKENC